jgi:GTP-binding protein
LSIEVNGGRGGNGLVSFSHLPKQPKGGPDGGDGGRGGNVYFQASEEYHSLEHLRKDSFLKARDGEQGGKNKRHGKNGKDLIISVPPGTTIYEADSEKVIADLISDGEKVKIAEGGIGGKGNMNFATSTNQAPRKATPGKEGIKKTVTLMFSPQVDIIVIGPPNSGKSSLIAYITGENIDVASYPFSTKKPHLWTYMHNFSRFTFLDTNPLIPDSVDDIKILSKRARVLLCVVDSTQIGEIKETKKLLEEIEGFSEKDLSRKVAYVITKTDLVETLPIKNTTHPVFTVSVKKEEGIEELKKFLFEKT